MTKLFSSGPKGNSPTGRSGFESFGPELGWVENKPVRLRGRDTGLVIGPPGSGKSAGVVIPYVAGFDGAVVTSSTRPEVLKATGMIRAQTGRVWIADFEDLAGLGTPLAWDIIEGCAEPRVATARAAGLVAASPRSGKPDRTSAFFENGARIILQGLLHAAAVKADGSFKNVLDWSLDFSNTEPQEILLNSTSTVTGWGRELNRWCRGKAPETTAGLEMTVSTLLEPMQDRRILDLLAPAASGTGAPVFSPSKFLATTDTLYCLSRASLNASTAPIVTALVESIYHEGVLASSRTRTGKLDTPLAFILDEITNTAPLASIGSLMSEGGGNGFHTIALCQGFSQLVDRWGPETAETIFQSATAKLFFGGSSETQLLNRIADLIGKEWVQHTSASLSGGAGTDRSRVSESASMHLDYRLRPDQIRKIPEEQAIFLYKDLEEILTIPHWFNRQDAARYQASNESAAQKLHERTHR